MVLYPPRPSNISIPAVVAGNILQNDDTSISAIDNGYDGSIVMKTQNTLAMLVNPAQHVAINTELIDSSMFTINNDTASPTFRMSYQDSFYFDGWVTPNGNTLFIPSCDDVNLNPKLVTTFLKNFNIDSHDGGSMGLQLGGALITASASELNYVDVPAGQARSYKALVLDGNSNITGINALGATTVTGTLLTANQPNITQLNNINVSGEFRMKGALFTLTGQQMSYIQGIVEGNAYPSKALILNSSKNITGINSLTATTLTGTLTNGAQPNITSLTGLNELRIVGTTSITGSCTILNSDNHLTLKTIENRTAAIAVDSTGTLVLKAESKTILIASSHDLNILSHNGSNTGLRLAGDLVTATAAQLNAITVTRGIAAPNKAVVLDDNSSITGISKLSSTALFGTIYTSAQPNISSVNILNIINHDGGQTGLSLNGTLITATATELNYTDTTPGTIQANKAVIVDSSKNITGINVLGATSISGTITTSTQPNITRVNTLHILNHTGLTGLTLSGTLVTSSADQLNRVNVVAGSVVAGKAIIADNSLNVAGFNIIQTNTIIGTLTTPIQPNIAQVNVLNIADHGSTRGLSLNGKLVEATAEELNRVHITPGFAVPNKAMILNDKMDIIGINNISANTITGELTSASQPNIRLLKSINITDHNGTTGLMLKGSLVTSEAYQLNYVDVSQGVGEPSKALVLDASGSITNIRSIAADEITGVLQTTQQPKLTKVNTLNIDLHNGSTTGLSLNGVLVKATADQINRLTGMLGSASPGKVLTTDDSNNVNSINRLYANLLTGTITTSSQPNITYVATLDIGMHNGASYGLSLGGTLITASADDLNRIDTSPGSAEAGKALVADNMLNITNINSLTANKLSGIIQTASQPNITSVKSLDIIDHNGSTGLRLAGTLVQATANQLNTVATTPGTAVALRAMITDGFNSITGINNISATKVTAQQLAMTGVIANFNTGALVAKTYSFTDFIGRMIDIQLVSNLALTNFNPGGLSNGYSTEFIGYINPTTSETYTFFVTCNDRVRLWVNGNLLLHSWAASTQSRASSTIFLNQNQWVPIYVQYQADAGSTASFKLEWNSTQVARQTIPSNRLAWDNNPPAVNSNASTQNTFTIYNTATSAANNAKFSVNTSGDLTIDASGNDITFGAGDNINIPAHNGSSAGLYLAGVLVQPTAYELNYLKVSPGISIASHAMVTDASGSITGVNAFTATSVTCANLTSGSFTINNLSLSGPLNNYNVGSLLIRQFTGPDVSGRIVDVNAITDINLSNYDPKGLNANYSLDISGYILPAFTDTYTFYAIANDRVRIWVNGTLIMNLWSAAISEEISSTPINLIAGQWTTIYIQFQNIADNSSLQIRWATTTLTKSFIPSGSMAWDNSSVQPYRNLSCADTLTIFSGTSGLTTVKAATLKVNSSGDLILGSSSSTVTTAASTNFNIAGHNGSNTGLMLAGGLVKATANELNYLSGISQGLVSAGKVIVLDANKTLSGFASITSDQFSGQLVTPAQPNITSFGTLISTLNTTSDIVVNSTNLLRLSSDATACYIQAGSSTAANSAADLFIGNYGATISASTRKLMIKSSGFVGIQTSAPTRALTINGNSAAYCLRLVNNNSNGTETAFCDLGVDSSSNLRIGSNVSIGPVDTATVLSVASGTMKIVTSSGALQIGNTTNATLPLEVGSTSFTLSTVVGYMNASGSSGIIIPTATSYSLRTTSSIIVNGTVCVTSDRRLKQNIKPLTYEECKQFINESAPVRFNYTNDDSPRCGLIAQDVAKSSFAQLVRASPHEGLDEQIEADGWMSPANVALNVSYEEIIPILMTTMKETMCENEQLKSQMQKMMERMAALEERLNS